MCNFNINRVNILGIPQGGGYSFYNYRKGIQKHICYNLKECEDRVLRINIQNSVYYLLGEYNLELGIKKIRNRKVHANILNNKITTKHFELTNILNY